MNTFRVENKKATSTHYTIESETHDAGDIVGLMRQEKAFIAAAQGEVIMKDGDKLVVIGKVVKAETFDHDIWNIVPKF